MFFRAFVCLSFIYRCSLNINQVEDASKFFLICCLSPFRCVCYHCYWKQGLLSSRLASNLCRSVCFCLLNAGIKSMCIHSWLPAFFYIIQKYLTRVALPPYRLALQTSIKKKKKKGTRREGCSGG